MESGHAATAIAPVLSAGVGIKHEGQWAVRLASFDVRESGLGSAALGIVAPRSAAPALVGALTGRVAPGYGTLRVLGYDLSTPAGRAAVRRQSGTAGRTARLVPGARIRGLVERAAKRSGQPGSDRHLLVAAILDRLALTPWAEVTLGAAPELIVRKARLAVACVHQPRLLVLDGLLDQLQPLDRTVLADVIRDLERDTALVALGAEADPLSLVCPQVMTLTDGILISGCPGARAPADGAAYAPLPLLPLPSAPRPRAGGGVVRCARGCSKAWFWPKRLPSYQRPR